MSMQDVVDTVRVETPPQTVRCAHCGAECGAVLIRSPRPAKDKGRWHYSCVDWGCPLAKADTIQHRSYPVSM